ncbi:PglL family O-oligosaccharyltransferase [Ramlibacter albus]|uniref:O-antigen ligase C-terminal domain-containing protein n=1 Tax=Ramlibacter albus TaxID=2079448 RepID=A0A923S0V4_9BURK|nr:O-antigen ligase family protein [Ramlibacter albus]MBC5763640.1 O-antigen ligase C-terminal domain-containing protein [Ramlibacter albus]
MHPRALRMPLLLLMVLPWLWAYTPGPSPNVGPLLGAWTCLLLSVPLLLAGDRTELLRATLPQAWTVAALVSAVIGLAQWFGVAPDVAGISTAQVGEAYGNLRQRNQFATLMSLGLAALVWAPSMPKAPTYAAAALLAVASVASSSRTGLLQVAAITVLAAAWPGARGERLRTCAVAIAAYIAAVLLLPWALMEWRGVDAATAVGRAFSELGCSSRKVLWGNVAYLIAQRPWTGWGIGELDYAHYATLYPGERFCDILDNAHNLPLHIAVELGVPAALLVTAVLLAAVWRGRPWHEADTHRQLAWTALLLIALHSMLEYPLWYGPFQLAALYSVLLLLPQRRPGYSLRIGAAAGAFVGLGLAAIAYAAFEYAKVSQAYRLPPDRWRAFREDPIAAAGRTLLFGAQLHFAELSISDVDARTAQRVHELALGALHYSPEPMVAEKLIESARLLGRADEAAWHAARYRAAFPKEYARWRGASAADTQHTAPILDSR